MTQLKSMAQTLAFTLGLLAVPLAARAAEESATSGGHARELLNATGISGGLAVHLGCGDGKFLAALGARRGFLVHGLDADAANVARARSRLRGAGLCGRASVDRLAGDKLPYIDNLVALLVAEKLGDVSLDEVKRVLRPEGVAYIRGPGGWKKVVKPRPKEIDEWTHYLHGADNNAVADDTVVGPPRRMQWVGSPRYGRHHDRMSSVSAAVSAGNRVFYIIDEGSPASILLPSRWRLIARDAFSGAVLWKREMRTWQTRLWPYKAGPGYLPRRLVAVGDRVYVTLGLDAPLNCLDAATGKTLRTYEGTTSAEEILFSEGTLFAVVGTTHAERNRYTPHSRGAEKARARAGKLFSWKNVKREVTALEPETGKLLWKRSYPVMHLTLAADGRAVYFHDGKKIVCLDRNSGEEKWKSPPASIRKYVPSSYGPNLVVHGDVVLFAGGDRKSWGFSAKTGEKLWQGKHLLGGHHSAMDLLVVDGLAWSGAIAEGNNSGSFLGLDPRTGETKRQFRPTVRTYWFHHRCHRAKATAKYILASRTGIEFIDPRRKTWEIHHWVRGACLYGIMPANGLIYAPPHPCACYAEAKLCGFVALAPAAAVPLPSKVPAEGRLENGPAYGSVTAPDQAPAAGGEWPTYRGSNARAGFTGGAVPAGLQRKWRIDLGGKLSSPVVAGRRLYVAQVQEHTLHALSTGDGRKLWSFSASGRVDSPPTIWKGRVLFGSADGFVYCLRASDGKLAWRFRAAPLDRRHVAFEQLESVWPVHGSVLVEKDVLYCVAGRSMFLDGGLRLLRLDPATGKKLSETILDDRHPQSGKNLQVNVKTLNMPVALPDILSSDGENVYMKSQRFDMEGRRLALGPHSGRPQDQARVQKGEGAHLFCPTGFLDDSWWHRTYWVYGRSFAGGHAGYYRAGHYAPAGRILCTDGKNVYGFGRRAQDFRWTVPLEHHLFGCPKEPEIETSAPKKNPKAGKRGRRRKTRGARVKHSWSTEVPMMARGMVLAGERLFIAGPPDILNEYDAFAKSKDPEMVRKYAEQQAAWDGMKGGVLWAVSPRDGSKLSEIKIESLPVFDGLIAAGSRLYMTATDGRVICFEGKAEKEASEE
jgi:outer membrane protein assembly factor BamB